MQEITTVDQADRVMEEGTAVLFKHNPTCPISARAHQEMSALEQQHPDAHIYLVDVLGSREVSNHVAERTGITHESPQTIVFSGGRPVYDASSFGITADEVAEHLASAGE